jgi:hypothetical protein
LADLFLRNRIRLGLTRREALDRRRSRDRSELFRGDRRLLSRVCRGDLGDWSFRALDRIGSDVERYREQRAVIGGNARIRPKGVLEFGSGFLNRGVGGKLESPLIRTGLNRSDSGTPVIEFGTNRPNAVGRRP